MTLKTVSFVQPNFVLFGPEEKPTYYLPYTAATLWAYSYQFDDIKEHYQLGDIIYRRDPIDLTAKKLASHDIVHGWHVKLKQRILCIAPCGWHARSTSVCACGQLL